jgi:hypothetical protein
MSPDIEWQVKDEAGEQTIVKTPDRSARWRWKIVVLIIVIGASLGIAYTNIKEPAPPPKPTPTLFPTPVPTLAPPPLINTIDKEALALAHGDRSVFMSLQDLTRPDWYESQQKNFETWGAPAGGSPPYEVLDSGSLADGTAIAEIYQYRSDRYFRETRFYRAVGGIWLRTAPDLSFWSGERTLSTLHFRAVFANEDQELARYVLFRFEDAYDRLCSDLKCPQQRQCIEGLIDNLVGCSNFPRVLTITLQLQPDIQQASWLIDHSTETITLPSPRVMGLYNRWWSENDPIENAAYNSLIFPIAHLASGNSNRWADDLGGNWYLEAITAWELHQVESIKANVPLEQAQQFYSDLLMNDTLLTLDTVWTWRLDRDPSVGNNDRGQLEAEAVIAYIEQHYGSNGLIKFLNALGPATSLAPALQTSLGISYPEFNRRWLAWLNKD